MKISGMKKQPIISVIIPTLNEAETIRSTLEHLRRWDKHLQIIVADGGSTDGTPELAAGPAKVIRAPRGRASQMNAGAKEAGGDVLLFLHSDTRLPSDAPEQINAALQTPGVVGGAFRVKIDSPGVFFYFASLGSNLRASLTGIYFGDQAIFARREVFHQTDGFPDIELMEDWEFSRSLHKAGKTVLLPGPAVTSARRWLLGGKWRTAWLMHKIKLLYLLGAIPRELKKIYNDRR